MPTDLETKLSLPWFLKQTLEGLATHNFILCPTCSQRVLQMDEKKNKRKNIKASIPVNRTKTIQVSKILTLKHLRA